MCIIARRLAAGGLTLILRHPPLSSRMVSTCFDKCIEKKCALRLCLSAASVLGRKYREGNAPALARCALCTHTQLQHAACPSARIASTQHAYAFNSHAFHHRHKDGDMNVGENSCTDRCAAKYWQVGGTRYEKVGGPCLRGWLVSGCGRASALGACPDPRTAQLAF